LQDLGDGSPLVPVDAEAQEEDPFLLDGPVLLLDGGIQVVVPPLTALLADATREEFSN